MPRNPISDMGFTLSHSQKLQVLAERQRRMRDKQTVRQTDLADWAKEKFNLEQAPSQATMSRILSTKDITSLVKSPASKRFRRGKLPQLEEALANWVREQQAAGALVKGDMLRDRGRDILNSMNKTVSDSEKVTLQFSAGWLCNFLRRWSLQLSSSKRRRSEPDADALKIELKVEPANLLRELLGDHRVPINEGTGHPSGSSNNMVSDASNRSVPDGNVTIAASANSAPVANALGHIPQNGIAPPVRVISALPPVEGVITGDGAISPGNNVSNSVSTMPINVDASSSAEAVIRAKRAVSQSTVIVSPGDVDDGKTELMNVVAREPVVSSGSLITCNSLPSSQVVKTPPEIVNPTRNSGHLESNESTGEERAKVTPQVPTKRRRVQFWFVGVQKLSADQFATRLVNYVCKRVTVEDKKTFVEAVREAAKSNGIDGDCAARSMDDGEALTELLLDDYIREGHGNENILEAMKQYFLELRDS